MSLLELAYEDGQWDALSHYKLAAARMQPTVQSSTLLSGITHDPVSAQAPQLQPPTSPDTLKKVFDIQEQGKTRLEPARKLAGDALCTTCRRARHYGPCAKLLRTPPAGRPHEAGHA
jgi:hypothetical protein